MPYSVEMKFLKQYQSLFMWLAVIALFFVLWAMLPVKLWFEEFGLFMRGLGTWGVIGFSLVFILGTALLVPGSIMTIAAGAAYGYWGFPLVMVASLIGSVIPFLFARLYFREKVTNFFRKKPQFDKYAKALETEGVVAITLIRFSPLIPFNLQNYFFGTLRMGLWKFTVTTILAMLPGTFFYIYLGIFGFAEKTSPFVIAVYFGLEILSTFVGGWMMRKHLKQ